MNTMKERWICPNMDVQVFKPQEYCEICEDNIYYVYDETGTMASSTKIFFDDPVYGVIDGNECNGKPYQTDSGGNHQGTEPRHIFWFNEQSDVNSIVNATSLEKKNQLFNAAKDAQRAGIGMAVAHKGEHYYGGTAIEIVERNFS